MHSASNHVTNGTLNVRGYVHLLRRLWGRIELRLIHGDGDQYSSDAIASVVLPGIGDRGLTLEQLRCFVAVVQCGGFQQAGSLISRSQSAVTQSIKRLEESLGCALLVRRQGHLLGATAEGQRFLRHALGVLEQVDQAVSALKRPSLKGRVRLGVPDDFVIEHLHTVISRCLAIHPSLRIDVVSAVSSHLVNLFRQQQLDIAICKMLSPQSEPGFAYEILRSEPLYWVADHAISFGNIQHIPLVAFPDGCAYRQAAVAALESHGKPWHIAYTSASYENIRRAVSAGLGIGVLSRTAVSAQHVILNEAHTFPALPMVHLAMAVRGEQSLYRDVADFLVSERNATPSLRLEN